MCCHPFFPFYGLLKCFSLFLFNVSSIIFAFDIKNGKIIFIYYDLNQTISQTLKYMSPLNCSEKMTLELSPIYGEELLERGGRKGGREGGRRERRKERRNNLKYLGQSKFSEQNLSVSHGQGC